MKITIKNDRYFIVAASFIWVFGLVAGMVDFLIVQRIMIGNVLVNTLGFLLFCFGILVRLVCRFTLKKGFSYMLKVSGDQKLITTGIYKLVRHPAYTGDYVAQLGLMIMLSSLVGAMIMSLLILPFIYRIKIEEQMLLMHFGQEYRSYMARTKKLIPFIY